MAKCSRCGRKGFFLKLTNGLCDNCASTVRMEEEQAHIQEEINKLKAELVDQNALFNKIKAEAIDAALSESKAREEALLSEFNQIKGNVDQASAHLQELTASQEKAEKATASAERKLLRCRELIKAFQHAGEMFDLSSDSSGADRLISEAETLLSPTVTLDLQCLSMRDLKKRYRQNEKNIQATFEKYKSRYTTKANITIYRLMVIALSAELQNVLHSISYGKLDDAIDSIKTITNKYYVIATDGNQSIAPTVKKFIGELDYYFQEAVKIEYEYYVQKERAREEQRAIREQMRQEAEERKELERQRKQIEKEESKFHDQIGQLTTQIQQSTDDEKTKLLQARIEELQRQLSSVAEQREKITQLQNGKAGNVYVISNIGSFGENVFKIGMTRRLEPMDRINELGNASVPFPFDVHSLIFSDDAVSLETKLHHILNEQRVNKVNLRKEFFRVPLDDLEKLVQEIAPTAEFKRTILAEQYRQSLSITHVSDAPLDATDDDEDDNDEDA